MITESSVSELIHASVSDWEYGCCGVVPEVGKTIEAALTALPAHDTEQFTAPAILGWDRERELVRFASCAAHWDPKNGDPHGQTLRLCVSWHEIGPHTLPVISATIATVYQQTMQYRLADDAWYPRRETIEYTRMTAVQQFPEYPDESSTVSVRRQVCGALMGLAVTSHTTPTLAAIAERDAARERASRTIRLTGPAVAFGTSVPATGDRLTINLGDPRLAKEGSHAGLTRTVSGEAGQVSVTSKMGKSGTAYGDIASGTPASGVSAPLYVVLTIDAADLAGT